MKCKKCNSEEFYEATYKDKETKLICFKCRTRHNLDTQEVQRDDVMGETG